MYRLLESGWLRGQRGKYEAQMQTSRDKYERGKRRTDAREEHLSSVWRALIEGRGATKEDFELILSDLAEESGFFYTAPVNTPGEQLQRLEGRRDVMGRILFLLDYDFTIINELRRAALVELQVTNSEAQQ